VKKEKTKLEEFLECLLVSKEYGFSDWCVVTHGWHESGGFQRVIGKYNFWGIKKPEKWTGEVLPISTHEYISGEKKSVVDYFIDFATCEQAMLWYCDLIERLYPEAYFNRQVPELYFKGLVSGKFKYATDPKYSEKLISLFNYLKNENEMLKNILK
jgi:flagellum-specific peptidoglycan hydrolase FlgJ